MSEPLMQVRAATLTLGGKRILDAVDLDLYRGEVVALVGPNGAGKSTLLSVMCGDEQLDSGEISLHGKELSEWTVHQLARMRAVQTQEARVSFAFTGEDVVRMGRAPWAGTPEEDRDELVIAHALGSTEARVLAPRTVQTLSGGEKSRISFARVLAQETRLMLLDEPTAPMDIRHQEQLMTRVRERASQGVSVVVVLHDLSLAAAYADRIILLESGKIAAAGSPQQVLTEQILQKVYRHPVSVFTHPAHGGLIVMPLRTRSDTPASTPAHSATELTIPEGELI